jgi:hypothetical protein
VSYCADTALLDLKKKMTAWDVLQSDIRSPVKQSHVFRDALELIERYTLFGLVVRSLVSNIFHTLFRNSREDFPIVENLMQLQETENKFLEDAGVLADSVQAIVQKREAEMERHIRQVDNAVKQNIAEIAAGLEKQGAELKEQLRIEQQRHRLDLDKMYDELLASFVRSSEVWINCVVLYRRNARPKPSAFLCTRSNRVGE